MTSVICSLSMALLTISISLNQYTLDMSKYASIVRIKLWKVLSISLNICFVAQIKRLVETVHWSSNNIYMCSEMSKIYEPVHEISNNVVCATSKASDQPAHTRSLIRAFASRLSIL